MSVLPDLSIAHPFPVFAPTDVKDWDRCPMYRQLKKEGRKPRDEKWTPNMLLGTAIHAGLAGLYAGLLNPVTLLDMALDSGYIENDEWPKLALSKLAKRGLNAAIELEVMRGGVFIVADASIGYCRPDLVFRRDGHLYVVDWKVSLKLDHRYEAARLAEFDTDHQMWHNAWEVGEYLSEPVAKVIVAQVVLTPRCHASTFEIVITPERLAFWLRGAKRLWEDMEAERVGVRPLAPRFSSCHGKYGACSYVPWCHEFGGDAARANVYYE